MEKSPNPSILKLEKLVKDTKEKFGVTEFEPVKLELNTKDYEMYVSFPGFSTLEAKGIAFDFEQILENSRKYFTEDNIVLPGDFEQKMQEIWTRNYDDIKKEVEIFGYDRIVLIPDNLGDFTTLEQKLTQGYDTSYKGDNFKNSGDFAEMKNIGNNKAKILLTYEAQNIKDHNILKQTLDKSPLELWSNIGILRSIEYINELPEFVLRLENGGILPTKPPNATQYLIMQRHYFKETGQHMDEEGWTWLSSYFKEINNTSGTIKTPARLVNSSWDPGVSRLDWSAYGLSCRYSFLGCRLSRSFE